MPKIITLGFTINDHRGNALSGEIAADLRVFTSNQMTGTGQILCTQGAASAQIELDIEEGGTGSIIVFYYPSEDPLDTHMSTPILHDIEFKTDSINFQLPEERNELIFTITPRTQTIEIVTNDKTGIVQTLSENTTLSTAAKSYAEVEGNFVFGSAKAGAEFTVGMDTTNGIVDTRMREGEVGKRYDVVYPVGNLILEQSPPKF